MEKTASRIVPPYGLWATWIIITLLVQPWRHAVSQDDGAYAFQTLSFASGHFQLHPESMAIILAQSFLGAAAIHLFYFLKPLLVLNLLSWVVFYFLVSTTVAKTKISPLLGLSIFAIPFWIQYGASFLYESYAALILVFLISTWKRVGTENKFGFLNAALFLSALFLTLQLQSLLVVPIFFGLSGVFKREYKAALSLILGGLAGLAVYLIWPHSIFQNATAFYFLHSEKSFLNVASCAFQLVLGLGIFWIPLARDFRGWNRQRVAIAFLLNVVFFLILWKSSLQILAAGVFFSDYLPRSAAAFIVAFGVWGWAGVMDLFPKKLLPGYIPYLGVAVVLLGSYAFRGVNDIRYTMLLVPLGIFVFSPQIKSSERLGARLIFFIPCMALSIFLNRYNLDTTQARWDAAQTLVDSGVSPHEITAGYGHDLFTLEADCVNAAYKKMGFPPVTDSNFYARIYRNAPRVYNDEWIPRYVIKPYQFFGKTLTLKANQSVGQNQSPKLIFPYRSLGFTQSLAVFENAVEKPAWCFSK